MIEFTGNLTDAIAACERCTSLEDLSRLDDSVQDTGIEKELLWQTAFDAAEKRLKSAKAVPPVEKPTKWGAAIAKVLELRIGHAVTIPCPEGVNIHQAAGQLRGMLGSSARTCRMSLSVSPRDNGIFVTYLGSRDGIDGEPDTGVEQQGIPGKAICRGCDTATLCWTRDEKVIPRQRCSRCHSGLDEAVFLMSDPNIDMRGRQVRRFLAPNIQPGPDVVENVLRAKELKEEVVQQVVMSILDKKKLSAEECLISGKSIREAVRDSGLAKLSVSRIRDRLISQGKLPEKCACGRPNGHRGCCPDRYKDSKARQGAMHDMHERQAAGKGNKVDSSPSVHEPPAPPIELPPVELIPAEEVRIERVDPQVPSYAVQADRIPDNPPEYAEIAEHALRALITQDAENPEDPFWSLGEKAARVIQWRKAKSLAETTVDRLIKEIGFWGKDDDLDLNEQSELILYA